MKWLWTFCLSWILHAKACFQTSGYSFASILHPSHPLTSLLHTWSPQACCILAILGLSKSCHYCSILASWENLLSFRCHLAQGVPFQLIAEWFWACFFLRNPCHTSKHCGFFLLLWSPNDQILGDVIKQNCFLCGKIISCDLGFLYMYIFFPTL